MAKVVSEEAIKKVVREYIDRMRQRFVTSQGTTTDEQIDCPQCDTYRSIMGRGSGCYKCQFQFPKNLIPPSPAELEDLWKHQEEVKRLSRIEETVNQFLYE